MACLTRHSVFRWLVPFSFALLAVACSRPMGPASSLVLLTDKNEDLTRYYTPVAGEVKEKSCLTLGPLYLIAGGKAPNHEALVGKVLDEYQADVLLAADFKLTWFMIPYLLYQECASISGTPAKLKK